MYKTLIITAILAINSAGFANAQSMSVGGGNLKTINLDGKFTKLKQLVDALSNKITVVKDDLAITDASLITTTADLATTTAELDKVKLCNDIKKIYDPNDAGADADGCTGTTAPTIRRVYATRVAWRWASKAVYCNSDEVVVGGGGLCVGGGGFNFLYQNRPYNNGWYVACDTPENHHNRASVWANCMKK